MLLPFDIEDLITLKNASTDAVTSALSTPVFSAISLIISAFVTVVYLESKNKREGKFSLPCQI